MKGVRLQERIHDTCHDVLSSHSFLFLPPCKQSHYAWCLSLSLFQLAQYSFHTQLLYVSQSRGPILSHLASLPDSVEITYSHMQTHSNILLLMPVLLSPAIMHIHQFIYLPVQFNWQLAWIKTGLKILSESNITCPALHHCLYRTCWESAWWMDACDEKTYSAFMKHAIWSSCFRAPVSVTVNYWVRLHLVSNCIPL